MNVVIAIDSFKGSMTSLEAGESASAGIRRIYPDADIAIRPLADGGEGTVDALTLGCGGTRTQVCVTGPLENRYFAVTAFWMLANCSHRNVRGCRNYTPFRNRTESFVYNDLRGWGSHQRRHCQRLQTFYYRNRRKCHKRWRNRYAAGTGI